jgi:hypothetical protein
MRHYCRIVNMYNLTFSYLTHVVHPNIFGLVYCARGKSVLKELYNSKPLRALHFFTPHKGVPCAQKHHFPFWHTSKALWPSQQKKILKRKKETQGVPPYRKTVSRVPGDSEPHSGQTAHWRCRHQTRHGLLHSGALVPLLEDQGNRS